MFTYKHLLSAPVFECDGHWFLRVNDIQAIRLRHIDGTPIDGFQDGWQTVFVYNGLGCMYLLGLERHGLHVTWLVAPDGRRLGDKLSDLQPDQRMLLREAVLSRGFAKSGGLIGDGLQLVETSLLRDILDLGASDEVSRDSASNSPSQEILRMLGAPHDLRTLLWFGRGDDTLQLQEGWNTEATGSCRAVGTRSIVRAGVVPPATCYLLTLTLTPVASGREDHRPGEHGSGEYQKEPGIEITVNGSVVGDVRLDPKWQGDGADLAFWLPPQRIGGRNFEIMFRHSQDFLLTALRLAQGRDLPDTVLDPAALMLQFENIGDNCEFGLVQRHFGSDPVGLLRFAGLQTPRRLIRFLDDNFGNFGEPGSLGVSVIGGEYWIIDHVYGMAAHTFRYQHEVAAEEVIRENEIKAGYLKRKLVEDLEDGEKILVYKRVVTQDPREIVALHAALNRFGTVNKLLWVTQAKDGHLPGDVEWVGDRLLKGYVGAISLTNAHHFDPEAWLLLCRNAFAVFEAAKGGHAVR